MSLNMRPERDPHAPAREKKDFDLRVVVGTAIVTVVVAIAVHVGLRYLQLSYNRQAQRHDAAQPPTASQRGEPPGPSLRPTPIRDLHHFRREQEARLTGYGWADEKRERVRIPITRAMQLLTEHGLPTPTDTNAEQSPDESNTPDSPSPETP